MDNGIISAVLTVGITGLVFGILLAVAAVIFKVNADERIGRIEEVLPGANCGGCGFAGCSAYADAVVEKGAPVNCCSVGGSSVAEKVAEIMGQKAEKTEPMVARVLCAGSKNNASDKYLYHGVLDCNAAGRLAGGQKDCEFGCLGFGTCTKACMFDAIHIIDGIAKVDEDKCTACGMCVKACPKNVIELVPKNKPISVLCKNKLLGKETMKMCSVGCIGCKICENKCPFMAISVADNLAKIDYDRCEACGLCAKLCPKKAVTEI